MKRMLSRVLGLMLAALCLTFAALPQLAADAADTTPPTGTIIINNNRSATNTPNVTLALTWDDGVGGSGVSRMRFSNDGATWSAWETLAATRAYTLPGGDGHKTVRVQYLDKANNRSAVYSDYILLDTTAPTGGITINSGAATTTSQYVSLGLTWSDGAGSGVSRMRFSDNGSTWTAWETPKPTCAHTLPAGWGNHTVRVQYTDSVGNYSTVYNDYIKLVPPRLIEETVMLPGSVPLVMVWIPDGTFTMGSPPTDPDSWEYEVPQHSVTLDGFWMGKYELSKGQWYAVMNTQPWFQQPYIDGSSNSPVVWISWNDAQSFITALNTLTGKVFRLPSESEWEYACRAGTVTRFYWGDDLSWTLIGDYAWWLGNAYNAGEGWAHVSGAKAPNAFGLCDMSGNAWEWCEDDWHNNYKGAPADGQAWVEPAPRNVDRVYRGGSFMEDGRSAGRKHNPASAALGASIGFRVCR